MSWQSYSSPFPLLIKDNKCSSYACHDMFIKGLSPCLKNILFTVRLPQKYLIQMKNSSLFIFSLFLGCGSFKKDFGRWRRRMHTGFFDPRFISLQQFCDLGVKWGIKGSKILQGNDYFLVLCATFQPKLNNVQKCPFGVGC